MPEPVQPAEVPLTSSPQEDRLEDCIALCLSGGGYRAMLFHVGVIWYLNDAGYLQKLARISSVSGGSITAGVLALAWPRLAVADRATAFRQHVTGPLRKMASTTIDAK
ncbi:MAG TPA: patatin-like phospholipase family protein, partial [Thermoanaerobaculia bacterium]|nr:patatin-like phospholipase family protein [Thermoanaerobaculia bacterium]